MNGYLLIVIPYLQNQIQKTPENLYEYLQQIGFRLPMYIGSKSLKDLQIHIEGYRAAERVNNIVERKDFMHFHDFVASEYRLSSSGEGWPKIILKHCRNNEDSAIEEFYRLLDRFYLES